MKNLKTLFAGICVAIASISATTSALAQNFDGRVRAVRSNLIVVDHDRRTTNIRVDSRTRITADYRNNRHFDHRNGHHNNHNKKISLSSIRSGDWVRVNADRRGRDYVANHIEVRR